MSHVGLVFTCVMIGFLSLLFAMIIFPMKIQIRYKSALPHSCLFRFYFCLGMIRFSIHPFNVKSKKSHLSQQKKKPKLKFFNTNWFSGINLTEIKPLLKKIKVSHWHVDMTVGTGEAASTAISVGVLWSFYGGFLSLMSIFFTFCTPIRGNIIPSYNAEKLTLDGEVDIDLQIGSILWGLLKIISPLGKIKTKLARAS